MRYAEALLLAIMLVLPGCKKPPAETLTAGDQPPLRPLESLAPTVPTAPSGPKVTAETPTTTKPTVKRTEPAPPKYIIYKIQEGDTLWSLAGKFLGDSKRWTQIVAANPGLEPKNLAVGQQIRIPSR